MNDIIDLSKGSTSKKYLMAIIMFISQSNKLTLFGSKNF